MKRVLLQVQSGDAYLVLSMWQGNGFPCRSISFRRAKDESYVGVYVLIDNFETYMFLLNLSHIIRYQCYDAQTMQKWKIPLTYEGCEKADENI